MRAKMRMKKIELKTWILITPTFNFIWTCFAFLVNWLIASFGGALNRPFLFLK